MSENAHSAKKFKIFWNSFPQEVKFDLLAALKKRLKGYMDGLGTT